MQKKALASAKTLTVNLALIAAMATLATPGALAQGTAEAHVKQAEAFHQIGRFGDAEKHYNLAVKQAFSLGQNNPNIPDVLASSADFFRQRGNYGRAEQLYLQAIQYKKRGVGQEHIDLTNLYMGLGFLYYGEDKYYQAEEQYRSALSIYEKKLRTDKNIPNFNKRDVNLKMAECLEEIARCVEKTKGANDAASYRAKAGQIKASPMGDYYN